MISKFRNAGQTCVCSNRVFVQSAVYDEFLQKILIAVADLKVGAGTDEGVTIGPLINENAARDVRGIIDDAANLGAKVLVSNERDSLGINYVPPTVLTNVDSSMKVFYREIFGPVAPLFSFDTESEVVDLANDTPFGLAAYVYSRDVGRVWRVSEGLEYGMVGVNTGLISNEMSPFGGVKESGQGREGSKYGLDDYLEIKSITIGGIDK